MPSSIDLPANAMVALTRDSLVSLRAALFRDVGANAAALLQEAGFAGGPAVFAAFGAWLHAHGQGAPETLAASEFASSIDLMETAPRRSSDSENLLLSRSTLFRRRLAHGLFPSADGLNRLLCE